MYQGTTPSLVFTVKGENLSDKTVYLTIKNNGVTITKHNSDLVIVYDKITGETEIVCRLTQKETLSLKDTAIVHIRYTDAYGHAWATEKGRFNVETSLNKDVLPFTGDPDGTPININNKKAIALTIKEQKIIEGVSPVVSFERTDDGALMTVKDITGTKHVTLYDGLQGIQGPKGDTGDKGDTGPKGDKGETGARGPQGEVGPIGPQGIQGSQGPKGDKGETGSQGPQGIQGVKGDKGDKGDTGDKGEPGDDYVITQENINEIGTRVAASQPVTDAISDAQDAALEAEAITYGTKNGVPVPATDPHYENNAKHYAQLTQAAETTAVQAINTAGSNQVTAVQNKGEQVLNSIPADYTELSGEVGDLKSALNSNKIKDLLRAESIFDTVQTIEFYPDGKVKKVLHTGSGIIKREDEFRYATDAIIEIRTLSTGESVTITSNTATLTTTIVYSAA